MYIYIKKKKKKKKMSLQSTLPLRIDEGPNWNFSLLLPQDSLGLFSPPLFMSVRFLKKRGGGGNVM